LSQPGLSRSNLPSPDDLGIQPSSTEGPDSPVPDSPAPDSLAVTTVTVAICTHRRPAISETLRSLATQVLRDCRQDILVIDNDNRETARAGVEQTAAELGLTLRYLHAPGSNISIARNAGLDACQTDWLAFIDDDEIAARDWLQRLVDKTRQFADRAAIFGPMQAIYDDGAPSWLKRGDFHSVAVVYVRDEIRTGYAGNTLINMRHPSVTGKRFDLALGKSGGEDTDFFDRVYQSGGRFSYAPTALVAEKLAPDRQTLRWFLRRRYRSGQTHGRTLARRYHGLARLGQICLASAKVAVCLAMTTATCLQEVGWRRWLLRAALHAGVVAYLFGQREGTLYTQPTTAGKA
jgi:succinoglycan biosynthesis protein ExoM